MPAFIKFQAWWSLRFLRSWRNHAQIHALNSILGVAIPTAAVLSLEHHGEIAETASALMGSIQMVTGAAVMAVAGLFSNGHRNPWSSASPSAPWQRFSSLRSRYAMCDPLVRSQPSHDLLNKNYRPVGDARTSSLGHAVVALLRQFILIQIRGKASPAAEPIASARPFRGDNTPQRRRARARMVLPLGPGKRVAQATNYPFQHIFKNKPSHEKDRQRICSV